MDSFKLQPTGSVPWFRLEPTDGVRWFRDNIPCMSACPVNTEVYAYVVALAQRDHEAAYTIARKPNPFPFVCGRVCGHPCEEACRRGTIDEPISIRALKRTATDLHDLRLGHAPGLEKLPKRTEAVAVIGSGPAGMSCAHDLARLGYQVTVFEASAEPGGMLTLGIPEYRLPRDVIQREIDAILELGVELKCNQVLGRDFSLSDLKSRGFRAVFLAVGAHRGKGMDLEGLDADGVVQGVELLLNVSLGYRVWLGHRVVVVGGGDVAMDSARTALRLRVGSAEYPAEYDAEYDAGQSEQYLAVDAAAIASRLGTKEVHIIYRRSRQEMPAHVTEVFEAEKEGIHFHLLTNPVRVEKDERGRVLGLWCQKMRLGEPDSSGRRRPVPIEGSDHCMECDSVVLAIGQQADLSFIQEEDGIGTTPYGTIEVDPETLATTAPGIFAGGDCAFGPRLLIDAEGDAHRAATSIHRFLRGSAKWEQRVRLSAIQPRDVRDRYDATPRQVCPTLPMDRRTGFTEIELPFSIEQAAVEANRCLHCHHNIFLDDQRCILCGACVDVCPYQCIAMVSASRVDWCEAAEEFPEANQGDGYAMILEETRCIRCGLCVRRCPVDAITLQCFESQGEWVYG